VSVPVARLEGPDDLADLARRFHDAHQRRYGHMAEGEPVEIVNFKVTGLGVIPKPAMKKVAPGSARSPKPAEIRPVYFDAATALSVPVFRRARLEPGMRIAGPAIIEEKTSTSVLYPGQLASIDEYLNVEVEWESARDAVAKDGGGQRSGIGTT